MDVIGRHQLEAEFPRPGNEMAVDLDLLGDAVILQFEIKILRPERLFEPINGVARLGQLVLEDQFGNFAGQAAGQGDQTLLVRRQQFLVDARLVIIALQVRGGGQLDEVLVAGFVLGQQSQMMISVPAAAAGLFLQAAARGDIDLAADDRFDSLFARRLVKINRAVKHAVVGDGQGGEFQFVRLFHQPVQAAGPIEQRILGVQMQMNKIGVRHEPNLTPGADAGQAKF